MSSAPDPRSPRAALVTGAAQRIGRVIALALAQRGHAVAIHANRSRSEADRLAADIAAAGGRAAVVMCDLAEHDEVAQLVSAARAAVGPLTLLVNNAAEFEPDEIGALERKQFDRHVAINLRAPLFLAQAFATQLPDGVDGAIVNLVDQRVFRPTPRFLTYGLTKSALHAATTTLAQALAPRIRVNAVAPGPTLPSRRQNADVFARQSHSVPLGRGPSPEDVAEAVLYLANARSVTGATIAVDGGQHLAWRPLAAGDIAE